MLAARSETVTRDSALAVASADSFEVFFTMHYPRVVAIARRILADAHLAEDVAQDVFASFYRRSHPIDSGYAVAWLHAATAHTALNVLRGNRRRAKRETVDGRSSALDRDAGIREFDPEHYIESRERCNEVRAVLRRLSPKHAIVLALRYSGLSYADVAAALDVGINQVGTLLARAETAFKKEIDRVTS